MAPPSSYVFCNSCGHRNPPESSFCSSCGSPLDNLDDRTVTLTAVDPLLDATGTHDDVVVPMGALPRDAAVLIVRSGRAGGGAVRPRRRRHPPRSSPRLRDHARRHHGVAPARRDRAHGRGLHRHRRRLAQRYVHQPGTRRAGRCSTTVTSCRSASSVWSCSSGAMAEPTVATHLSIGEVLGLLLEEFPDVTISKIRFLESQGLIEPERTPSGYRKFYEADVELLRLILREQREHFLPLRSSRTASTPVRSRPPRRREAPSTRIRPTGTTRSRRRPPSPNTPRRDDPTRRPSERCPGAAPAAGSPVAAPPNSSLRPRRRSRVPSATGRAHPPRRRRVCSPGSWSTARNCARWPGSRWSN